jgi:hypothetical protein
MIFETCFCYDEYQNLDLKLVPVEPSEFNKKKSIQNVFKNKRESGDLMRKKGLNDEIDGLNTSGFEGF